MSQWPFIGAGNVNVTITSDIGAFQQIATAFSTAAGDFAKATNPENLERLRALRQRAVEGLLALRQPLGATLAEPLNAIATSCLTTGMRGFPRDANEEALFARSRNALASASADSVVASAFAAILMAWHAFELDALPALATIPRELRRSWLSFLLELPPAFTRLGDGERFVQYLERLCDQIQQQLHASTEPEPFGMVIIEGMACGKAVIASQAGGAAEVFTDGENALSHPAGDAARLSQQIERLARDKELRTKLGEGGRATAERLYDSKR